MKKKQPLASVRAGGKTTRLGLEFPPLLWAWFFGKTLVGRKRRRSPVFKGLKESHRIMTTKI